MRSPTRFEQTSHISFDTKGNLYIADSNNQRIRRIDPAGVITTIAGDGTPPAANLRTRSPPPARTSSIPPTCFRSPMAISSSPTSRTIASSKSRPPASLTTIAGNGAPQLLRARNTPPPPRPWIGPPPSPSIPPALIYFAELHSNRIGRINADGQLATVAAIRLHPLPAELNKPTGIAIDRDGNVLIADTGNHRIRKAAPAGVLTTIAGTGTQSFCGDGGPAAQRLLRYPDGRQARSPRQHLHRRHRQPSHPPHRCRHRHHHHRRRHRHARARTRQRCRHRSALNSPCAIALDANDDLYIVDWQNFLIRKVAFPAFSSAGIVDGASFSAPPSPGGIFSIFGASLAASTAAFSTVPLPTQLAGVSLEINGTAVPLYLVSPTQINAQLPFDTPPGPATAVLVTPAGRTPPVTFTVAPAAPAIFVAFAQPGVITAYVTGLGAVAPPVPPALPRLSTCSPSRSPPSPPPSAGLPATVQFAGLAPGFVGLGQVNVLIPTAAPTGDAVPLILKINDQTSKPAPVAIR